MKANFFMIRSIAIFAISACCLSSASGQNPQPANTNSPLAETDRKVPLPVLKALGNQDVFNQVAAPLLSRIFDHKEGDNGFRTFINDLHLRPKLLQATGNSSNNSIFGLEFDYKKALASHVLNESSKNPVGLALNLEAKGDIASEADQNPNNLIEAGGSFHLFQGVGGIDPKYHPSPEAQTNLQNTIQAAAKGDKDAYRRAAQEFTSHMRPQLFYDIQAHGTYETDQQFDNQQWAYGGKVGFVFRDWRSKSDVGWFNVFDYPFAALRSLINNEEFQPSGRVFPSILAGVDLVDPTKNEARLAIDPDKDVYSRMRIEVAFKTPFMRFDSGNLYVSAAYRHFQELGASSVIRSAKLDRSDYFVVKVDLPHNFNISYSTGKLPLDQESDDVYAVGWSLNF